MLSILIENDSNNLKRAASEQFSTLKSSFKCAAKHRTRSTSLVSSESVVIVPHRCFTSSIYDTNSLKPLNMPTVCTNVTQKLFEAHGKHTGSGVWMCCVSLTLKTFLECVYRISLAIGPFSKCGNCGCE